MPVRLPLTVERILAWCDDHHARTGSWPRRDSGPVAAAPGETWANLRQALDKGLRGLPGGQTLAQLLAQHRGAPHPGQRPPLTEAQVVAWARAHHAATGRWPNGASGPVADAPGESWAAIQGYLRQGLRGLPGGENLAQLLARRCDAPAPVVRPPLTIERILAWADRHYQRTGRWPTYRSGPVADAPGESWFNLNDALVQGWRGLPGGSSLARLLSERRGRPRRTAGPPLTVAQILGWAEQHLRRTGWWPTTASGPVLDAPGENWRVLNMALWKGHRGLPRGGSLARLRREHRKGLGKQTAEG
jgi:hypothetical protein